MRICMVTHSLYESDCRVMRYAEALAARGDKVEVIALRKEGKPAEETIAGVRVFRIQKRDFQEKKRASFLRGVGLFLLKAAWLLTKKQLAEPYDLVHVHSIPDFMAFAALVPKLQGSKVILDIHDILPELYASKFGVSEKSFGYRFMLLLERASTAFADHVIIANHIWRDRLLTRSVKEDRCSVFLNYPDRRIFSAPRERRQPTDKFVILYPGTLNRHQGLDVAIRAFAQIKDARPEAVFHIHGEGRSQDQLMALVEELGLQGRVLFKPMLPVRQIAAVMGEADLAVVPKRADSFGNEAFSTKILEFMSVGVPVVVSNTKIDTYYFNDRVVTFFRDGDSLELAQKISFLMENPGVRMEMAANAAKFVQTYDWEIHKNTYLKLVDSLVYGRPARIPAKGEERIIERARVAGSGR